METIEDYFTECSETTIKDNYVVVYEVLDEMLDNGFPLATEANILKELIKPPNMLRDVVNSVTGKSNVSEVCYIIHLNQPRTSLPYLPIPHLILPYLAITYHPQVLPTGQLSSIPWRRAGVKYTNNEAYFDVIEEVRHHHHQHPLLSTTITRHSIREQEFCTTCQSSMTKLTTPTTISTTTSTSGPPVDHLHHPNHHLHNKFHH